MVGTTAELSGLESLLRRCTMPLKQQQLAAMHDALPVLTDRCRKNRKVTEADFDEFKIVKCKKQMADERTASLRALNNESQLVRFLPRDGRPTVQQRALIFTNLKAIDEEQKAKLRRLTREKQDKEKLRQANVAARKELRELQKQAAFVASTLEVWNEAMTITYSQPALSCAGEEQCHTCGVLSSAYKQAWDLSELPTKAMWSQWRGCENEQRCGAWYCSNECWDTKNPCCAHRDSAPSYSPAGVGKQKQQAGKRKISEHDRPGETSKRKKQ